MQWKRISVKMQLRQVNIMKIKASWGPLKVWGPRGSIPCSLGGPGKRVMGREEGRRGKGYKEGGGGGAQDCFAVASERWEGEMGRCNVTEA